MRVSFDGRPAPGRPRGLRPAARLASFAAAIALAAGLTSCGLFQKKPEDVAKMSGEEIEVLIRQHGGTPLSPTKVSLEGGFDVTSGLGGNGINVLFALFHPCREYCWMQVVKKYLDREVVKKPSRLIPNPTPQELADPNFPDFAREDRKITDDGWVVDHLCHPTHKGRAYTDDPAFPNDLFRRNTINPDASVFIAEFELCARCANPADPPGQWMGCLKWFFVRVRGKGGLIRSYLVTQGAVAPAPSQEFTKAVEKWQAP